MDFVSLFLISTKSKVNVMPNPPTKNALIKTLVARPRFKSFKCRGRGLPTTNCLSAGSTPSDCAGGPSIRILIQSTYLTRNVVSY